MTHYSSTVATDLPFTGKLGQGEPSRDSQESQHPRYAPIDVVIMKHAWLISDHIAHLSTFLTIIPFLMSFFSLGQRF